MKYALLRLGVIVVALILTLGPSLLAGLDDNPSNETDPVRISDYRASFTFDDSGNLSARELITADFPDSRHGIFRYFDTSVAGMPQARLIPTDLRITMDDAPVPVEYSWESGRRYRVAKIGDPDTYVSSGTHEYRIDYVIKGALRPANDGAQLLWNVVPPGWSMNIDRTEINVALPAVPTSVRCTVGSSESDCAVSAAGTTTLQIKTAALAPRTAVTLQAELPLDVPEPTAVAWDVTLDRTLGQSIPTLLAVLVATILAGAGGYLWERRSREPAPGFGVMYAPPAGLGPAQAVYMTRESLPDSALVATLLHQAEQGLVDMTVDANGTTEQTWTVTGRADATAWAQADDVSRHVGRALGIDSPGSSFKFSAHDDSAGRRLAELKEELSDVVDTWATHQGLQRTAPFESRGRLAVVLAGIALLASGLLMPPPALMYLWPLAAFVAGGVGLVRHGVGRRRTDRGRHVWSEAGGFRRLLATDASVERFDFSGKHEIYTSFIPYAVAFGCADQWATKYRTSTGHDAPEPAWLTTYGVAATHQAATMTDLVDSFDSSLGASISAYQAAQSSDSSSSSSSSAGGGGGGGSW